MQRTWMLLGMAGILCRVLPAQEPADLLARMKAMEARIQALEAEVQALKAGPAAPPEAAVPPPVSAEPLVPNYGAALMGNKLLNPEMAAIGTFRGVAGYGGGTAGPALEMQESEVSLQAIVDPYARADFFLSFGQQGVDLEEGYLTFSALPGELQLKTGKMRAAFGKVNTLHLHNVPWIDRPLVTRNLLNDEEGISDAGLSLSRILPAPGEVFLEATGQVYRGESGEVFQAHRRSDLGVVGHLRDRKSVV